jgi:hypothetical protein
VADYTARVLRPPRLEEEGTVAFTRPQKAALVTNMMTVLLSETGAQPGGADGAGLSRRPGLKRV